MLYKSLGSSGVKVSNICLGTLTFGQHSRPGNCSEAQSHAILDRFVELGGNFIDTANNYSNGESEAILGSWIKSIGSQRDELVIATKGRLGNGREGEINGSCLSRKHLVHEVEESLARLNTSYIDLYQWHCWDKTTPLLESLTTMNDLIRAGKVRYFGVSNFTGWQLQKLIGMSQSMGLSQCVSLQQQYSLLNRELELELVDVCENEGLAVLPWSPLKGGWLTGKFTRSQIFPPEGTRLHYASVNNFEGWESHTPLSKYSGNEKVWNLIDKMKEIGDSNQRSVSQVALKWLLQKKYVTSIIMGCKTIDQLEDNMAASGEWELSPDDMKSLDQASSNPERYPFTVINRYNNTNEWKSSQL